MHIFICWSEDRSQTLANALSKFLRRLFPRLTSFVSKENIPKGARWFDAVGKELDRADAGLVCLTREALQSGRNRGFHERRGSGEETVGTSLRSLLALLRA